MADENVNLSWLVPKVLEVMAPVATWLRATFYTFDRNQTEEKGLHDLVSYVDRESEERLLQGLLPLIPGSAVLAEESGAAGDSDWVWVVDPLDGTTNFLHFHWAFISRQTRSRMDCRSSCRRFFICMGRRRRVEKWVTHSGGLRGASRKSPFCHRISRKAI